MIIGDSSYWDDFFQRDLVPSVLTLIITAWKQMPKPGASDLEDKISVKLYSALVKGKDRNKHPFLIKYQDTEVDANLAKVTGKKDIAFYPPANEEEIYLCLEAKRLNATISGVKRSLADEYVKNGMQRFVDCQYSRRILHGAMLAYVLDGQTAQAMTNVENNIRARHVALCMLQNSGFMASSVLPANSQCKETHHQRKDEPSQFKLHHVFVD